MFRHIRPHLPPYLTGSIPGRGSTDLAMQLQLQVEKSMLQGMPIFGTNMDLHKAFNTLGRPLLGCLCSRLGLHEVWTPYNGHLENLQRFLQFLSSIGLCP